MSTSTGVTQQTKKLQECNRCKSAGFPNQAIGFEKNGEDPTTGKILWKLIEQVPNTSDPVQYREHQHKQKEGAQKSSFSSRASGKWVYEKIITLHPQMAPAAIIGQTEDKQIDNVDEALKTMQPITTKDGSIQFTNDGRIVLAKRRWESFG